MNGRFDFDDSVRADLDHMRDHKRFSRALLCVIGCAISAIVFAAASVVLA